MTFGSGRASTDSKNIENRNRPVSAQPRGI